MELVRESAPDSTLPITSDLYFIDDLGYHSLALVELGFALEEEFSLDPITPEDVEHVETVGQLIAFILERLQRQWGLAGRRRWS